MRPSLGHGCRAVVANYARLNAWLDIRDLEQEATVAALEARADWRQDGGSSRDLWEAWRVGLALSRFVAAQRVPVSLPKRKDRSWQAAAAAQRVPLEVSSRGGSEIPETREHPDVARLDAERFEPMEAQLDTERAVAEVRRILAAESEAARAILLGGDKSAAVAARLCMPRRQVYEQTARAMRALRAALSPRRAPA